MSESQNSVFSSIFQVFRRLRPTQSEYFQNTLVLTSLNQMYSSLAVLQVTSLLPPFCVIFMKVISRSYLRRSFSKWNGENISREERNKVMFHECRLPLLSENDPPQIYILESLTFRSPCEAIMMWFALNASQTKHHVACRAQMKKNPPPLKNNNTSKD